ncbi:acyltransferase family protein [Stutzerimonas stutzeri]|uniref:acyltransferase family protein n=1 Tax=Stutzerimonas stutzeri TaxID=316 RepID=UPI0015E2E533|nr:acyltransferase family protein [Stutzerimonas stutzeri]MBA1278124.1 acyltransferase [Stutzerimonas stutzeri]
MKSKQLAYRPDIDGLRALAVILVLLFHFELGVSGGFIGVDVFFVISGYLITQVIRNGIVSGRFTFQDFYVRRLLRLHPALLVTLAATLAAGFLLMDPASFSDLAASAKYATFSASNFYFWLNQGYFDAASQTKPLLHTWSLATEWQFYLVWPFIVWASLKASEGFLKWTLVVLTVVSLVASQVMLGYDSSAAYFMMPFRVFELSIGAILIFAPEKRLPGASSSAITLVGIAAIIAAAFFLTAATPFPGVAAILPCLGAAACIYAGQSTAGAVLRCRLMVFVGLISYSIYLVHWPLVVFYKYYVFREITLSEKLALLVTAIALGAALYYSVEKLFMAKRKLIKPIGISAIAAACAVSVYGCSVVLKYEGIKSRVPAEYLSFASDPKNFHINNYGGHGYRLDTVLGDKRGEPIAIFGGDSFALQYAKGFDHELAGSGKYIDGVFQHGCVISGEYTRVLNNVPRQACRDKYADMIKKLDGNDLTLIYAQSWTGYRGILSNSQGDIVGTDEASYQLVLLDMLERMRSDIGPNRKMIIIGSQPFLSADKSAASCLVRPQYVAQECDSQLSYKVESSAPYSVNAELRNFAKKHHNTFYIEPANSLCNKGICKAYDEGKILYSDGSHLSIDGSIIASRTIVRDIIHIHSSK